VDPKGSVLYANKAWHSQIQSASAESGALPWMNCVAEESRSSMEEHWAKLINEKIPTSFECCLTSLWVRVDASTGDEVKGSRWIICSAFPELANDGSLQSVWGCNTDIR